MVVLLVSAMPLMAFVTMISLAYGYKLGLEQAYEDMEKGE
jgi:hypothetical protein